MTRPDRKPRSDTSERILDRAELLIQTRGYSAFSYQDIAEDLAVTKASIHYHFAAKGALGIAVIERYTERFDVALTTMVADETAAAMTLLDFYTTPYLKFSETADQVCLSGALAGEIMALPPEMRQRVEHFFAAHQAWLTTIIERGVARGEFQLIVPPAQMARLAFGALQGALLVKRATGDTSQLKDVIAVLKAQLTGTGA
jgi:TetR/AcrR family transcriptional regulator, transcriptional repressor for nem operon